VLKNLVFIQNRSHKCKKALKMAAEMAATLYEKYQNQIYSYKNSKNQAKLLLAA
jgi:protein-disulfide isomerase